MDTHVCDRRLFVLTDLDEGLSKRSMLFEFLDKYPDVNSLFLIGCRHISCDIVQELLQLKNSEGKNRLKDLVLNPKACDFNFRNNYGGDMTEFFKRVCFLHTKGLCKATFTRLLNSWAAKKTNVSEDTINMAWEHHKYCNGITNAFLVFNCNNSV